MEMRAAAIQLNSTADKDRNLAAAERLVREAAADGAELIALPEKWNVLGDAEALHHGAEPLGGPTLTAAASWARELGIHLLAGSIPERVDGQPKLFNTSVLIGPDGELQARYRKIHMFDVDVGGVSYRESENEEPGDEIVAAAIGGSLPDVTLGMTVCYDLRFPELYRILAVRGATVLSVPSAFTFETGKDHWEVLLRARAIENQAFVDRPEPGRRGAAAVPLLWTLDAGRPVGHGPRRGPRRRVLRRRRPRPLRGGSRSLDASLAGEPAARRVPLARGSPCGGPEPCVR